MHDHRGVSFALVIATIIVGCSAMTPNLFRELLPANRPRVEVDPPSLSKTCEQELDHMIKDKGTYTETVMALDASGKPGSGILAGNIGWLGHYDECMNLTDYRYCLAYFTINASSTYPQLSLSLGLCVPKNCSERDIVNGFAYFEELIPGLKDHVQVLDNAVQPACTKHPHIPYDAGFYSTAILFGAILLLVVLSSLYHAWLKHSTKRKEECMVPVTTTPPHEEYMPYDQDSAHLIGSSINDTILVGNPSNLRSRAVSILKTFFLSFSLPRNLPKVLSTRVSADSIPCLNGIRVISMLWIILCHTFIFSFVFQVPILNPLTGLGWIDQFGFMVIANGFFSVDSFFFLSGLLVCYMTLNRMDKTNGKVQWGWFYFHRYWRLTPALGATTLIYMFITPYLGDGPVAQSLSYRPNCPKYWWTNLLYINNFYPANSALDCIGWVWYLANDMQFFVISPIIIVTLFRFRYVGFGLVATLILGSLVTIGTLMGVHNLPVGIDFRQFGPPSMDYENMVYIKPYCRISPYLIGMMMGYFINKNKTLKIRLHPLVVIVGWTLAGALGFTLVYGIYSNYHSEPWSTSESTIYEMFSRLGWAVFLSWVVFACHYGYGGWVNSFLSYGCWAPLGRLTYSAYLLHPIILSIFLGNQGTSLYLSLTLMMFYFGGVSLVSYGAAALLSLSVEFPMGGIEKLFMPKRQI